MVLIQGQHFENDLSRLEYQDNWRDTNDEHVYKRFGMGHSEHLQESQFGLGFCLTDIQVENRPYFPLNFLTKMSIVVLFPVIKTENIHHKYCNNLETNKTKVKNLHSCHFCYFILESLVFIFASFFSYTQ